MSVPLDLVGEPDDPLEAEDETKAVFVCDQGNVVVAMADVMKEEWIKVEKEDTVSKESWR